MATATATGPRLLCTSDEENQSSQIVTLPLNGGQLSKITHDAIASWPYARWSPDARRIVAEWDVPDRDGPLRGILAFLRPDGHVTSTIRLPGVLVRPSFLPDGSHIVAEWWRSRTDDGLWVMRDDGSDRHRLTRNPWPSTGPDDAGDVGSDTAAEVSPDGKTVAFARVNPSSLHALYTVRMDGTHLRQILPFSADIAIKLAWSPDGSRIGTTQDTNFVRPGVSANVVTVRADGKDRRDVTRFTGAQVNGFFGAFSPDGRWIVYRLEDHDVFSLMKIHPDGTGQQKIAALPFRCRNIDWSTS